MINSVLFIVHAKDILRKKINLPKSTKNMSSIESKLEVSDFIFRHLKI